MADFFKAGDFKKRLNLADELVFDKQRFSKIRVVLSWESDDLDLCAFMVDENNKVWDKLDLVYFGSERRWLTEKPFNDDDFNPLQGRVSVWKEDAEKDFKNDDKWKERTLPLSPDDSVIGSWDDEGDGPCAERMHVLLKEVDTRKYKSIVFAAVISEKDIEDGKTFADIGKPNVSIINAENDEVLAEYKLDQSFPNKCSVCFGRLTIGDDKLWRFVTMADAYDGGMFYLASEIF